MNDPETAALENDVKPRRFLIIACDDDRRLSIEESDFQDWELGGIAHWLELNAENAMVIELNEPSEDDADDAD